MVNEAIPGLKATGLLKLEINLSTSTENRKYQCIVNCGATANFVSLELTRKIAITLTYKDGAKVLGANGEEMAPAGQAQYFSLLFTVQGNAPSKHVFWGINISHPFILGLPWL